MDCETPQANENRVNSMRASKKMLLRPNMSLARAKMIKNPGGKNLVVGSRSRIRAARSHQYKSTDTKLLSSSIFHIHPDSKIWESVLLLQLWFLRLTTAVLYRAYVTHDSLENDSSTDGISTHMATVVHRRQPSMGSRWAICGSLRVLRGRTPSLNSRSTCCSSKPRVSEP